MYNAAHKGREAVAPILLPRQGHDITTGSQSAVVVNHDKQKRLRSGKGSNILSVVRQLLQEPENWMKCESKSCYQFPGV